MTYVDPALRDKPELPVTWSSPSRIPITSIPYSGLTAGEKVNFLVTRTGLSAVGSVRLELSGPQTVSRTDNTAPYSLYDDVVGSALLAGSYQLSVTAYPEADGAGTPVATDTASFTLVSDTTKPSISVTCSSYPPTLDSHGRQIRLNAQVSEPNMGFSPSGDLSVSNGLVHSLSAGLRSSGVYEVFVTLRSDVTGSITAMYPAGVLHDEPGNPNTASDPLHIAQNRKLTAADGSAARSSGAAVEFVVTLDARNDCETATVDYATADGTATAGEDYARTTGTLTFASGETSKTVSVPVLDESGATTREDFTLTLSNPSGATLADATATGVIGSGGSDDSSPPAVTGATSFTVTEGDTAVGTLSATDADTAAEDLAWSLAGGADESKFTLTASGVLSLAAAKDYENPDDNGGDGVYEVTVQVSDGTNSATTEVTVTLGNRNEAPSADAGQEQSDIKAGATVTLSGSGTDPDADETLTYAWSQTAGTSVTLASASSAETTFTAPELTADETLRFRLRVTDAGGMTDDDETSVAVTESRGPLTASFQGMPTRHDGMGSEFSFGLRFSENFPGRLPYKKLKEEALRATNGRVTGARRAAPNQNQRWTITVRPHSLEAVTVSLAATTDCTAASAICTPDGRPLSNSISATVEGPSLEPLTAAFHDVPAEHEGKGSEFSFELRFSEDFPGRLPYKKLKDEALRATNGRVTGARRAASNQNQRWVITVRPHSFEEVAVSLAATTDCTAAAAICTPDGRSLSNSPSVTIEGPPLEPLTAAFQDVPAEHEGRGSEFSFELRFSEDFPGRLPYKKLKDEALRATNGRVTGARRAASNQNQRWVITVRPHSFEEVAVSLAATTDCTAAAAICTPDGRPLSNSPSVTVAGPVGISVADARVEEGAGAVLAFAVTLSRTATSTFSVDYATSDGSARAGEDYTAASGTLSFQAGESSRTIEVAVLDDAHDEGEETLTLRLSNASSGRLTDGEATGTIENTDLMPAALLARFGRATAEQVVEHIEERMAAPRQRGFRARFAGRELQPGSERDFALGFLSSFAPMGMGRQRGQPRWAALAMGARAVPMAMGSHAAWALAPSARARPTWAAR